MPLKRHIHKGLYGVFVIDPRESRPPADELVMVMNAFDTNFDAENEVYAVNTVANCYMHEPIKVQVGRLVRIHLVNLTEFDLINSFHLHGMFFDVFRTGTRGDAERAHRYGDAVPGRTGDSRNDVPLSRATSCSTPTRASSRSSAGWDCSGRRPPAVIRDEAVVRHSDAALGRTWLLALVPLVLLAALIAGIVWWGPGDALRGDGYPPVERLTFQRVELTGDGIVASVMNDGPDPVQIAQVQVDDAYWSFTADKGTELRHLGRTTLRIPYPWVQGEAHVVRVLTSTGTTFDYEIAVAVPTPRASARTLGLFALMGLYVGVVPVAIGLLWFPLVSRMSRRGLDFLLALTIGLLLFLLIDAVHEGLEIAGTIPGSFQGTALFAFGALGAYLGLESLGAWLRARRERARSPATGGWVLALLIAVGHRPAQFR